MPENRLASGGQALGKSCHRKTTINFLCNLFVVISGTGNLQWIFIATGIIIVLIVKKLLAQTCNNTRPTFNLITGVSP